MATTLIILASIAFAAAFALLWLRLAYAPGFAFLGLLLIGVARTPQGYPLLPVNSTMLIGWLCMTVIVMAATLMQPAAVTASRLGMPYIAGGAAVGMVLGLLGNSVTASPSALYAVMIAATVAGTFLGYLCFTRTPQGRGVAPGSGRFFTYLLAKGFPTALTLMQAGVILVLLTLK